MGSQPTPERQELFARIDEVLHYIWDPIGVCEMPEVRDEYASYVPAVMKLLDDGADRDQIVAYLTHLEVGMAVPGGRAVNAAETILHVFCILRGRDRPPGAPEANKHGFPLFCPKGP